MMYIRNGIKVGVLHFRDRKRPSLAYGIGNEFHVVASFNSDYSAKKFEDAVKQFLEGLVKEQENE
jgi:hypothetical protein